MMEDELWLVQYKDDVTFNEKLENAEKLLSRYKISRVDAAKELLTDLGIHCGAKDDVFPHDNTREVERFFKIPFAVFSRKNKSFRR